MAHSCMPPFLVLYAFYLARRRAPSVRWPLPSHPPLSPLPTLSPSPSPSLGPAQLSCFWSQATPAVYGHPAGVRGAADSQQGGEWNRLTSPPRAGEAQPVSGQPGVASASTLSQQRVTKWEPAWVTPGAHLPLSLHGSSLGWSGRALGSLQVQTPPTQGPLLLTEPDF